MASSVVRSGNPSIVGFDVPGSVDGDAPVILSALLDAAPARSWVEAFLVEAVCLREKHALDDVRVVGRNLNFVGRLRHTRQLVADVRSLAHRVNRLLLHQRVFEPRRDDEDDLPLDAERRRDLERVHAIAAVPSLLEATSLATGMRFVAVARVTEQRWTACAVYDLIDFGLKPGQDLVLETTICNEIRHHHRPVVFDQASTDPHFSVHPTPALYGFESYVSLPVFHRDGSFFGTLCALDPEPARLDATTVRTLQAFARLIGDQLDPDDAGTSPLVERLRAIQAHAAHLDPLQLPATARDAADRIRQLAGLGSTATDPA